MQILNTGTLAFHVHAISQGGTPIVFANSLGTDFRIWDDIVAGLGARSTIRYDKRGHGLSDQGSDPFSIEMHADDLAAILDDLGVKQAVICGLSVGGMIALCLSARRPDLVAGLILCDTAHRIGPPEMWENRIKAVRASGLDSIADGVMQRWFAPAFHQTRPDALRAYRNMMVRTPLEGYVGTCAAIRDADLTAAAQAVAVPSLCMVGDTDGATPPDLVRSMADLIPGSSFHVIPTAGHLPCVEQPGAMTSLIEQFLKENVRV